MPVRDIRWREELAWAAGFFDGEGCTFIRKHDLRNFQARLTVGQNDPQVLHRFCAAVGVGKVYGPYHKNTGRTDWYWMVSSFENSQAVVALLWAHLSPIKRAQATRALLADSYRPRARKAA